MARTKATAQAPASVTFQDKTLKTLQYKELNGNAHLTIRKCARRRGVDPALFAKSNWRDWKELTPEKRHWYLEHFEQAWKHGTAMGPKVHKMWHAYEVELSKKDLQRRQFEERQYQKQKAQGAEEGGEEEEEEGPEEAQEVAVVQGVPVAMLPVVVEGEEVEECEEEEVIEYEEEEVEECEEEEVEECEEEEEEQEEEAAKEVSIAELNAEAERLVEEQHATVAKYRGLRQKYKAVKNERDELSQMLDAVVGAVTASCGGRESDNFKAFLRNLERRQTGAGPCPPIPPSAMLRRLALSERDVPSDAEEELDGVAEMLSAADMFGDSAAAAIAGLD